MAKPYSFVVVILLWGVVSCTPVEDLFPKEIKAKIVGTWTLERILVLQENRTQNRWDTVTNLPNRNESIVAATFSFSEDFSYRVIDPSLDLSQGRGLFLSRFDFVTGWGPSFPYGGVWEFDANYTVIYISRGVYEALGLPAERWQIEELSTNRLVLYKETSFPANQRVWFTLRK
jgi:PAS domain-containing protein